MLYTFIDCSSILLNIALKHALNELDVETSELRTDRAHSVL